MNRVIKFRAWDRELKGWIAEWVNFAEGKAYVLRGNYGVELTNADVVQFTGLKDKNGKEIFEGDVVDYIRGGRWGKRAVIEYQRGEFVLVRAGEIQSTKTLTDAGWNRLKIIGNIYENPELLKP